MDINELNKLMSEKFGSVQPNKEERPIKRGQQDNRETTATTETRYKSL